MPRAENRKKPPNLNRNTWEGGHSKEASIRNATGASAGQSKKQELIERMRKVQESKKAQSSQSE